MSLAAALALPTDFPERDLILLVTFVVILVTLVGQGLTLPAVLRWAGWDGDGVRRRRGDRRPGGRLPGRAGRDRARPRPLWPTHQPLLDRLESGLRDRTQHLATEEPEETAERRQERIEHEEIQRGGHRRPANGRHRAARRGEINDETLREIERELDLEELRMEG